MNARGRTLLHSMNWQDTVMSNTYRVNCFLIQRATIRSWTLVFPTFARQAGLTLTAFSLAYAAVSAAMAGSPEPCWRLSSGCSCCIRRLGQGLGLARFRLVSLSWLETWLGVSCARSRASGRHLDARNIFMQRKASTSNKCDLKIC